MAESARTFSKGEFIGGIVAALAVGFFLGSISMELRQPAQMPMQTMSQPAAQMPGQKGDGHDHTAELAHIGELEIATAQKPGDQAQWIELGNLYFDTHQARKSIAAYEKAIALGPVSADVWTDLGIMHREAGEPKKALEIFDTALKLDARHENALYNKGVVLLHDVQDRTAAVATWEKLLQVNPAAKNPEGRALRGMVDELKKG
ncbi:MAG: tetratricopeptide repeat protein [Humidesulfovibrio sp.]|uniref:tetratricopeptide repeat protein n=1 Tax=Humidesulfovibrio sp. TaxID=2910988 RepID=UPI00273652F1|nr:tetratricopeptide repeat protein [Humidesulfovibrio sp.]MDP2847504.1 tetratricopeptide repeat protein [Humidesulfovibrio sp.]